MKLFSIVCCRSYYTSPLYPIWGVICPDMFSTRQSIRILPSPPFSPYVGCPPVALMIPSCVSVSHLIHRDPPDPPSLMAPLLPTSPLAQMSPSLMTWFANKRIAPPPWPPVWPYEAPPPFCLWMWFVLCMWFDIVCFYNKWMWSVNR